MAPPHHGLLHSVEEQTWRVPLLVSWSAEDDSAGTGGGTAGYGVAEKARAVLEEFQQRPKIPKMLRNDPKRAKERCVMMTL